MSTVLLATDADWLYDEVDAALGGEHAVARIRDGADAAEAAQQVGPDLVVLDLQTGNMGGMATSMLLAQEMRAGRIDTAPIMLLLDREQDAWLASQADADAWMVKPIDSFRLRRAARTVIDGGAVHEGPEAPAPVVAAEGDDPGDTADDA